ncbi:MAG: hypothetical protein WEC59_04315 [Salibacteraceae bacterium]
MTLNVNSIKAQESPKNNFFGINPSVTVEPFYNKGELDINIFPIVYQRPLTKRLDLRLTSILNLGIRNIENKISHIGLETGLPIFFKLKEDKNECSKGFFVAPIFSLTRNRIRNHNNLGFWIEPGYNLLFDNNIAMTFGLQLGATYFSYDNGHTNWGNHFGIKIIIGKWI